MTTIGIDLGTTNSLVAIPQLRTGRGFFVPRNDLVCSVVTDRFGRRFTPSVVAEDDMGNVIVGYSAKARAGLSPIVMFAKRYMGKDERLPLGQRRKLLPEDAAAEVLKYLKSMAEQQLAEKVTEAVITVPAYFDNLAKIKTEEAGKKAGLRVAKILLEPVAAALMYCLNDPRDPLRVMTYDLGGGTFDVAVLEKRDGIISSDSILAFDGNRYMGGYNFDKRLSEWMADELDKRGYDLSLDSNERPADRVIRTKLMVIAEKTKIELSKSDVVPVLETETGILDRAGNPVVIDLEVSRETFEGMIEKDIEETIEICRQCMEKKGAAPIDPATIQEIIMVGGSSRIPLVRRRLEEAFGREPRLVDPDLCVGIGAAIAAGSLGSEVGHFKLDPIPEQTDLPSLTITGRLIPGGDLDRVQGCTVQLQSLDGSYHQKRAIETKEGGFAFADVKLAPEQKTDFKLTATTRDGRQIGSHQFSVLQGSELEGPVSEDVPDVLAKSIGVMMIDGPVEVILARTPLPCSAEIRAEKSKATEEIRIPILEEDGEIGEIRMRNIPPELPVGSEVLITLTVQKNYQIRAQAYVTALAREEEALIQIIVPQQRTCEALRREYEILSEQAQEALAAAGPAAVFADAIAIRLNRRLGQCQEMLQARQPDLPCIQDYLGEIRTMIKRIAGGWRPEPPKDLFDEAVLRAHRLVERLLKEKPECAKDGYAEQLAAIKEEAKEAYQKQDDGAWKSNYRRLVKFSDNMEGLFRQETPPPVPDQALASRRMELERLKRLVKDPKRLSELSGDFDQASKALRNIDAKSPDVWSQIRLWDDTQYAGLCDKILSPEEADSRKRHMLTLKDIQHRDLENA